jgi:murein DD-endopeptidase MepM/ murein hydrolase activator NlpD
MLEHALHKRTAVLLALGLSGAVVAFATVAPSPQAEATLLRETRIEDVPLHASAALLPEPASYLREERFQLGDTLAGLLERLGVSAEDARKLARTSSMRFLRTGQPVHSEVGTDGRLVRLSFPTARELRMVIEREDSGYRARQEAMPLQTVTMLGSGEIHSSLFAAADAGGVPDSVALQLADIFAGDVDFHRDLRRGDRFTVVYEQHFSSGRAAHAGRVLAAEFTSQGRVLRAVHFDAGRGASGYYAPDGSNLRKAFLRSPLEYTRISSGFGMRRHPFLRSWRAHDGIDYAAPTGTRVRAAGDGFVEFVGQKGGYGNVVILRHRGQYSTLYAHLSRFGAGVRRGARVDQGDVIGHVGATGWATGSHLHYEFRIAGRARNPYGIAMPAGEPVPAAHRPEFLQHAAPLVARLDRIAAHRLAQLN